MHTLAFMFCEHPRPAAVPVASPRNLTSVYSHFTFPANDQADSGAHEAARQENTQRSNYASQSETGAARASGARQRYSHRVSRERSR